MFLPVRICSFCQLKQRSCWIFSGQVFWSTFGLYLVFLIRIFHIFCCSSEDYLDRKLFNSSEFVEICRNIFILLFTLSFLQNDKLVSRLASIHVFGLNQIPPSNHGWLKAIPVAYVNYCKNSVDCLFHTGLLFQQIINSYQNIVSFILEQAAFVVALVA